MKRLWQDDELVEQWTLQADELAVIHEKQYPAYNKLGLAMQLKYFQHEGQFPEHKRDIPKIIVEFIGKQLGIAAREFRQYRWQGRTIERHQARIRLLFGFRKATKEDAKTLKEWLIATVLPHQQQEELVKAALIGQCRSMQIAPPTRGRLGRIVRSALRSYEARFCASVLAQLSETTRTKMDALLEVRGSEESEEDESKRSAWYKLKTDAGRASLDSILTEFEKLELIEALELPVDLFAKVPIKTLEGYRRRIAVEDLGEIRRHPERVHYTLMAAFCWVRRHQIIDNLVDLLMDIVHGIGTRAEKKIDKKLLKEIKRVHGKDRMLYEISEVSLEKPNGTVKEVVYPVVSKATLAAIVEEYKANGSYDEQVNTVMRGSYSHHYRQMLPEILKHLRFQSNNQVYRPVIEALELLKKYADSEGYYYDEHEQVPMEGIVPEEWSELVEHTTKKGKVRINRIAYEMCVLHALRDKLSRRVIWVEEAGRFQNPDADLPQDFADQRAAYYAELGLRLEGDDFVERAQQALRKALKQLDEMMLGNQKVKFEKRAGKSWIVVSPSEAQEEPHSLSDLKEEIRLRWGWVHLLDMLKETDFRVNFTALFKTVTEHENLPRGILQKRLLLCLYGLGTNTGLKRITAGDHGENYRDLLYVRKRFVTKDNVRAAIAEVVNAIFRVRQPHIWGEATSACASDSKKFGAWDQNLLTEWHIRYRGAGIMVYWHVERKSVCIYSQIKSCSSSEVASMIEGVLRHCTDMTVEKNYVDTRAERGRFRLLFLAWLSMLPRLKNLGRQKLYCVDRHDAALYPNLTMILATHAINWEIIRQEYGEMVKFATALRLGIADAESILRRFTKGGLQHPTYQALSEYGKVCKTIFLCQYLASEALRREIDEGLNVIENWNSANVFIFYGKTAEISSNKRDDQELAILALHLLQICLVYVNTLMVQHVLKDRHWLEKLQPVDFRALTPLFYTHVTPYGMFRLNMAERLLIDIPLPSYRN